MMNEEITSCWDTFVLMDRTLGWNNLTERLFNLTGAMELARDEGCLPYANKCIRRFRRIVKKFAERN